MKYGYFKSHTYHVNGGLGGEYAELKRKTGADSIYYDYYRNQSPFWIILLKKLQEGDVLFILHLFDLDLKQRDKVIMDKLKELQKLKVQVFIQDANQNFQCIDIENDSLSTIKERLFASKL